jgi:hypothetical protein
MMSATAAEGEEIRSVVKNLYLQNEKELQCSKMDGSVDESLIKIPLHFFSRNFMSYYRSACLNERNFSISFDIRTGENGIYTYKDSRASVSNVHIGDPSINGAKATVVVTYDLDQFSFKEWGNFARYRMVKEEGVWKIDDIELGGSGSDRESITSLPSIKSLKAYIAENVKMTKNR